MNLELVWLAAACLIYAAAFGVFVVWRIARKIRQWNR